MGYNALNEGSSALKCMHCRVGISQSKPFFFSFLTTKPCAIAKIKDMVTGSSDAFVKNICLCPSFTLKALFLQRVLYLS